MRHNQDPSPQMGRRDFLQRAGLVAGAVLLDACGVAKKQVSPISPSSSTTSPNTIARPVKRTNETLIAPTPTWEQDFSNMPNGGLDPRLWSIATGNLIPSDNEEAETLTDRRQNIRVQDGLLIIEAIKENINGKAYSSAHVKTQGNFSFQYGRLEVDLRAPQGIGTWPAAWLLPNAPNATWPLGGEIDFFESVGAEPGIVYPDVHTYDTEASHKDNPVALKVPDMYTQFNTYGVELTPGKITFTHNGESYHHVEQTSEDPRSWPFNQPYYLILNLAMGGNWGGEDHQQYPPDGIQGDGPWEMAVRAVRYYDMAA